MVKNESELNLVKCGANQQCKDTEGSYECYCFQGFNRSDGNPSEKQNITCVNIDECKEGSDKCEANANCTDTEGGYTCKSSSHRCTKEFGKGELECKCDKGFRPK